MVSPGKHPYQLFFNQRNAPELKTVFVLINCSFFYLTYDAMYLIVRQFKLGVLLIMGSEKAEKNIIQSTFAEETVYH